MKAKMTVEDLRRDHPNKIPPATLAKFYGKDPQHFRNMLKAGKFPFAIVNQGRRRASYLIPTERFIAWHEGQTGEQGSVLT